MQPGATLIFAEKGATRQLADRGSLKGVFSVRFILKTGLIAPKRSKKSALSENPRAGATCR
ncbi:hypothetical protein QSV36_18455 [Pseudomonas sp. BCRC 81390]|uniref:hypothetical protein n=1 Tax=Pseudomonas sp. BCRC 81390 TaxID=3054778 RepID=UPI0025983627|nr:hypothetical protein [Pseudomonas sp. BCRC 81390]MDM3887559.1 hypothetical protein [Pseudomonas sp. BCRC 81390]